MQLPHGFLMCAGYMELAGLGRYMLPNGSLMSYMGSAGVDRYGVALWLPDVSRVHGVCWCWEVRCGCPMAP